MTTRSRILLAALTAAILPLALLGTGARLAVRDRLTAQHGDDVRAAALAIERNLQTHASGIRGSLDALSRALLDEGVARAALLGSSDVAPLIPWAPNVMPAAGLDFLLLLDDDGRVLSSGHFRNDYGRLLSALRTVPRDSIVLLRGRRAGDGILAFAIVREYSAGGTRFILAGGVEAGSEFIGRLVPSPDAPVSLVLHEDAAPDGDAAIPLPLLDVEGEAMTQAALTLSYPDDALRAVLRALDIWIAAALGAGVLLAFIVARMLATRVNRPLEDLARQAARVNIERYDARFSTKRRDEVGSLARTLDGMLVRLREGAQRLRDAERRATVGDMARQVNHDIRNGLLPIRNVIRHLGEVAEETPAELATVFGERQGTLTSGIVYLESLATNYARLAPRLERHSCAVNDIVSTVLQAAPASATAELDPKNPVVTADPVALRRIVENLVVNAVESLPPEGGRVIVRTSSDTDTVRVAVSDTGTGIPQDVVERIFDDFYTTKERGTGLGLSIVRRLAADMGGRVSVASAPGQGSTFTLELPLIAGT